MAYNLPRASLTSSATVTVELDESLIGIFSLLSTNVVAAAANAAVFSGDDVLVSI